MIESTASGLRVTAPMVIANARALLEAARSFPPGELTIDLSLVPEADSSSLAVLFAWMRVRRKARDPLRIVNPPDSLLSLAALYGVSEILSLA